MPNFTFRLAQEEVDRMDALARTLGIDNRVDLLRAAVASYDARYGRSAETDVVSQLVATYGADATLTFTNQIDADESGSYVVQTTIVPGTVTPSGDAPSAPYDPIGLHVFTTWEVDAQDNITVWIAPRTSEPNPARIFVGKMPHRPSASISVKLIDLRPTPTLRWKNADGSTGEIALTAQQAIDLAEGQAIIVTGSTGD